jgi:hypothetical protein
MKEEAHRRKLAAARANFDTMCRIPVKQAELVPDPVFMSMKTKVHAEDALTAEDIKDTFLKAIWEGDEIEAIRIMEKRQQMKWEKSF